MFLKLPDLEGVLRTYVSLVIFCVASRFITKIVNDAVNIETIFSTITLSTCMTFHMGTRVYIFYMMILLTA
jgi:hypothetical protein